MLRFAPTGRIAPWGARPIRIRLGQDGSENAPGTYIPTLGTRLSKVPVDVIRNRHLLALLADENGNVPDVRPSESWRMSEAYKDSGLADWSDSDYAALVAVLKEPAEQELQDIALIDGFFGYEKEGKFTINNLYGTPSSIREIICGENKHPQIAELASKFMGIPKGAKLLAGNPFFCTPPQEMPKPTSMYIYIGPVGGSYLNPWRTEVYPSFFGIDPSLPWEDVKGPVLRTVAFLEALVDYPFPPPLDIRPQYWYAKVQPDIRKFIAQDIIVVPALARMWITLAIGTNLNDLSAQIIHDMERQARHHKRTVIISKIMIAATFAVITVALGYALAPLIEPLINAGIPITSAKVAGAMTSAVQKVLSAQEAKSAAEDMKKMAQAIEADAPAYAAELDKVGDTFNFMGEQIQGLSQEDLDAVKEENLTEGPEVSSQEVGTQYDAEPSTWLSRNAIYVGGGAAAAGILAVILASVLH
jgi:hypothetical protein